MPDTSLPDQHPPARPWERNPTPAPVNVDVPMKIGGRAGKLAADAAKAEVCRLLALGSTIRQAMAKVGREEATYRKWRDTDQEFSDRVDRIIARRAEKVRVDPGDFGTFRQNYLDSATYWHQWQWVDLLEGRPPRDLHPAQMDANFPEGYKKGWSNRILINTPPNHAKSTTMTMDYSVYRVCKDPNVRIIIVSQSQPMAATMIDGIKLRLENPDFAKLQEDFAPAGGFRETARVWQAGKFTLGTKTGTEKDPTVQSIGVRGQIYGRRADLIILDDIVTTNSTFSKTEKAKVLAWLRTDVLTRLEPNTGRAIMLGTRVGIDDLYSTILSEDVHNAWTYLRQPAILEEDTTFVTEGREPAHITLWPQRFGPAEIETVRADYGVDQARFRLVYQQESSPEDAVFPEQAVRGCLYAANIGPLDERVRPGGMFGLHVIAGLDPAASGYTAIVVLAFDKRTGHRWVLDVHNRKAIRPNELRELILELTNRYQINEWRIEKNALQTMLTQDQELRMAVYARGGRIIEHHTGKNKWDSDFGVATLRTLFLGAMEEPKANLIHIPTQGGGHRGINTLVSQLVTWTQDSTLLTDCVMALWFADLGCREKMRAHSQHHANNRWTSARAKAQQKVMTIDDLRAQAEGQRMAGLTRWG